MPLLDGHEFIAQGGLHVAYRASRAPQVLRIAVISAGLSTRRSAPLVIKRLLELMNAGAAGGSLFSPADGRGERLSGPWDGPDAFGPEYHWVLRVSSVSPLFLRTMVDQLRRCGWDQAVTRMRIEGEIQPHDDAASVDTARMTRWLSDSDAYVDEWPMPPFCISTGYSEKARWSVRLAAEPQESSLEALRLLAMRWVVATASYVDDAAHPVLRLREHLERHLPRFSLEDDVFSATYEEFHHRASASRAVLMNMLHRFSELQAPILEARLEHPALGAEPRPHVDYIAQPSFAPWIASPDHAATGSEPVHAPKRKAASAEKKQIKKSAARKKVPSKKATSKKKPIKKRPRK